MGGSVAASVQASRGAGARPHASAALGCRLCTCHSSTLVLPRSVPTSLACDSSVRPSSLRRAVSASQSAYAPMVSATVYCSCGTVGSMGRLANRLLNGVEGGGQGQGEGRVRRLGPAGGEARLEAWSCKPRTAAALAGSYPLSHSAMHAAAPRLPPISPPDPPTHLVIRASPGSGAQRCTARMQYSAASAVRQSKAAPLVTCGVAGGWV